MHHNTISIRVPFFVLAAAFALSAASCDRSPKPAQPAAPQNSSRTAAPSPSGVAAALQQLRAPDGGARKDGIAVAILIDTSGSMKDAVADADGSRKPKIDIARRCVVKVVKQAEGFAKEQPGTPLLLGIYEFSSRNNSSCRKVLPMKAPDVALAESALRTLKADGGTPIGQAIIQAKRDLDAAGLSRTHILVVTDGENTDGFTPGDVVAAIGKLPEAQRPGVYFVAFDVAAAVFKPARDAGAAVLPAANEQQLQTALDELVGGKILLEK
ncbi:MAG: VWA domain-containing protein [Tepidisphaerales bacterium]